MSYYREIRLDELTRWLEQNAQGCCGETPSMEELAQRMIDSFDILFNSNTPT